MTDASLETQSLHDSAYAAFDAGRLREASELFTQLIAEKPDAAYYHYMRGLVHKYLGDWATSYADNRKALELGDSKDEAALWNAGIAATGMGDWKAARECWRTCGISIPEGDGPIESDRGVVSIRLNAGVAGETLYAHRIDVVRARLDINVPLADSGYRYGDIVLHDGAATGERSWGKGTVPVLNALQRLTQSEFATYVAFVQCDSKTDAIALDAATGPGIGLVEDWSTMSHHCMRCSYGVVHRHEKTDEEWVRERTFGIAAQSRAAVDRLLENWVAAGNAKKGVIARLTKRGESPRQVDAVEYRDYDIPERPDGFAWWVGPDDKD